MIKKIKKQHKIIIISIVLPLLLILTFTSTFAWSAINQGAFSVAFDMPEVLEERFELSLLKLEIDVDGNPTPNPVEGAGFTLFDADNCMIDVNTNEQRCTQIILDSQSLFHTDVDGAIVLDLAVGNYFVEEHHLPNGFAPDIDANGNSIVRWYFSIRENAVTGDLELVIDGVVVEDGVIRIFNRRLSGDLIIEKRVVGEIRTELIDEESKLLPAPKEEVLESIVVEEKIVLDQETIVEEEPEIVSIQAETAQEVAVEESEDELEVELLSVQAFEFRIIFRYNNANLNDEFTFIVYENGMPVDNNVHTIRSGETLFLQDNQQARFSRIPVGVEYRVTEIVPAGFNAIGENAQGFINNDETSYVIFTNTEIPLDLMPPQAPTSLQICKKLENEDANFPSATRFNFELNINKAYYMSFELGVGECRVVSGLEVGSLFEVLEVNIPSRYKLISSGNSTGTLTEKQIVVKFVNRDTKQDIPVEKRWELGVLEVELPDYITVQLLDDTTLIDIVNITPDNAGNWIHNFTVPRYRNGVIIAYNVVEVPIPGWHDCVIKRNGSVIITNTAVAPIEVALTIEKQIKGDTPLVARAFEFELADVGNVPMLSSNRITIQGADIGNFEAIKFTETGIFEYTIHEVIPVDTGNYIYDSTVFRVMIVVSEINGELVLDKTILREDVKVDTIIFINEYLGDSEESDELPLIDDELPPQIQNRPPQSHPPQTGDETQLQLWRTLSILSGAVIVLYAIRIARKWEVKS